MLRHTEASSSHALAQHLGVALRSNTALDALVLRRVPIPVQSVRGSVASRQLELWALSEPHAGPRGARSPASAPRASEGRFTAGARALCGAPSVHDVSVEETVVGSLLPVNCVASRVNAVQLKGATLAMAHAHFRPYELRFLAHRVALATCALRTLK